MIEGLNETLVAIYTNHRLAYSLLVLLTTTAVGVALETIASLPEKYLTQMK